MLANDHRAWASIYSTELLQSLVTRYGTRNLSNYQNHEIRWLAERIKACRAELKSRKVIK